LKFSGTMVSLPDGRRLLLADFKTGLQLATSYGQADLPTGCIVRVEAADRNGLKHTVETTNGSRLSGVLGPKKIAVGLALGGKMEIAAGSLLGLTCGGARSVKPTGGVTVKMLNGDVLLGRLAGKTVSIRTEFGDISPYATAIRSIRIAPAVKPPAVMAMWSGALHRGQLLDKHLSFEISPGGPALKVSTTGIASITWSPPK